MKEQLYICNKASKKDCGVCHHRKPHKKSSLYDLSNCTEWGECPIRKMKVICIKAKD